MESNGVVELARYFDGDTEKVVTVSEYQKLILNKDKDALAKFIFERLSSRYINPFEEHGSTYKQKNGFSMMANYCLLIETLQSFKNGWGDSNRKSNKAFKQFFTDNSDFEELNNKGAEIYDHIRCGILHQGETTGGWKITRIGCTLVDKENRVIDAYLFGKKLKSNLNAYKKCLVDNEWDSKEWNNFRTKMSKIINNTLIKS